MKISSDFTNDRGVPLLAVRIEPGEPYCNIVRRFPDDSAAEYSRRLIADKPLIEFYDRRYPHTDLGQFVARYYASTLAQCDPSFGLLLYGGVPDWHISAANFRLVHDQLIEFGDLRQTSLFEEFV